MSESYRGQTVPLYVDVADGPLSFRALVDSGPIPRFANVAARNTAIPAPVARGKVVWRNDITGHGHVGGGLEVYTGSAWRNLLPSTPPSHTHAGSDLTSTGPTQDIAVGVIPNLPASKITSGVFDAARIPSHGHAYLPLAGGVLTGSLRGKAGTYASPSILIGGGTEGIFSDTANALEFRAGDTHFRFSGNGLAFLPGVDNNLGLGGSEYRWKYLYAVDGSINTSDPSMKHIDGPLVKALDLIRGVNPIIFRWRDRPDEMRHFGFDATQVAEWIPEVVKGEPGHLGVRERDLLAILWGAVRELDRRLETA